jgi:hypothetical protein
MPSSSARAAAARKRKGVAHAESAPKKQPKVTQQERVEWALSRVRAAQFRMNLHKEDRALALAVTARKQEYERELLALAAITSR